MRIITHVIGGQKVKVYTNLPLPAADRAVIVIHGVDRNFEAYGDRMLAAAKKAGVADRTAIIAPLFDSSWSGSWSQGGPSKSGLSSFAVADYLLGRLSVIPEITRTVVCGHSAGAQFTQRYAMLGAAPVNLSTAFVVMNPSSFCYLDAWRPSSTSRCPKSATAYKYGLDGRKGYVAALSASEAIAQYISRTVVVANGDQDTVDNGDEDMSCPAMAQGKNRLSRGKAFSDRIKAVYPAAPHSYLVVPGVAHSSTKMFASPVMRASLFG